MTYLQMKVETLQNPAASFWLKKAIEALDKRDPVDAWADAETLQRIMRAKLDELQRR
jgi:hypothetical protein